MRHDLSPSEDRPSRSGLATQITAAYGQEVDRTHRSLLMAWAAFAVTFGLLRGLTYAIHEHLGPFHDIAVGGAHLHHYVWGIAVLMLVGLVSLIVDSPRYNPWLGAAYGFGCALVVDEYALLLNLSDVYWAAEGRVSVDVALGAIAVLGLYLTAAHFWNHIVRLLLGGVRDRASTRRRGHPRR